MSKRAMYGKAMLLITLKPQVASETFNEIFANRGLGRDTGPNAENAAKAILMDESEISGLPHQQVMANSPPRFHAVYQLRSDGNDFEHLGAGIADAVSQLEDWIDRGRSALLLGTEVAITQGWGPIKVVMPLRRRADMTHDDFMQSWYGRHANIGEAVEGVRYRQNHVDAEATRRLSRATGITFEELDGLAESFFPTPEAAVKLMNQPQVAVDAIEDEKAFIDHSRSHFGFYRVLT